MEERYSPKTIEPKWQSEWEKSGLYRTPDTVPGKENYYQLVEFPYPSGNLHVGHWYAFTGPDIHARYMRMTGKNVLFPIGFDAFGLPAENAAIKRGLDPRVWTEENMAHMREQIASMGTSFDRSREVITCHPEYYRFTQWLFLRLFEAGLAMQRTTAANWCPSCKTVLANEQVKDGKCDRCGSEVVKKELPQWQMLITKYADRLIDDLDGLEWAGEIKTAQKNWIGRSVGTTVKFTIHDSRLKNDSKIQNLNEEEIATSQTPRNDSSIEVFTTRVDTIFGCTYVVVAPEHPLVASLLNDKIQISNFKNGKEVEEYVERTKKRSDIERTGLDKEKTGVKLEGIEAVNPFTGESVPVYVADYVLGSYGTGAVMAVPAHDERDFAFAKKYGLPINQSVTPDFPGFNTTKKVLEVLERIYSKAKEKGVSVWALGGLSCAFHAGIVYRGHSDIDLIVKDDKDQRAIVEIFSDLGFREVRRKEVSRGLMNVVYANDDEIEVDIGPNVGEFGLMDEDFEEDEKNLNGFRSLVLSARFARAMKEQQLKNREKEKDRIDWEYLNGKVFVDDGVLVGSGDFTGLSSADAREKMTAWLEERGMGGKKTQYRLRDWTISRQRYWGVPIPLVHCEKCGWQAVPDAELPVVLPEIDDYLPREDGKSPLAKATDWVNVTCPKCGGVAERETDTMDTFVDSSWYFLRYADAHNAEVFASREKLDVWMPVDFYSGGAEHVTMHLLYSRFFHKALFDLGLVTQSEPYVLRRNRGLILGPDGNKMSKSKGNVIDPDEIVADLGADTMRLYLAFIGPYNEVGNYPWNPAGVVGVRRFLDRVWRIHERITNKESLDASRLMHRTLAMVTGSLEDFKLNTGVAALMGCLNELEKLETIPKGAWELFLLMLAPYAPHIAEELWSRLGGRNTESIFLASWPVADPKFLVDEEMTIVISVNGKVRANIVVPAGSDEESVKALALAHDRVKPFLEGKEIRKTVFVQDKIMNFVI
jgi:leucyl-tRNA synthetase